MGVTIITEELKDFYNKLSNFVNTGEYWEGKIKLPSLKRFVDIKLFNRKGTPISINLKYYSD